MRVIVIAASTGFALMCGCVIHAMIYGSLLREGPILVDMPWGLVSLVDIYLGLILFSFWVLWREKLSLTGFCWTVSIISLGNMLSCVYILKACREAQGNMMVFWLGRNSGNLPADV